MGAGYLVATLFTVFGWYIGKNAYFHIVDFSSIVNTFSPFRFTSVLDYPKVLPYVAAAAKNSVGFDWTYLGQAALLFIPVSLVTICEHIGDHKNMSGIIDRDLLKDPGLSRTLIGDGVATALSGGICGAANTTYGENVAVVGVTKIASVKVIGLACLFTIGLAFFSPLMAITQTIPACVTGGVSLILYGFIASSGVKMLIHERIDLGNTKNIFVAAVILVTGIGALTFQFGTVATITSTAVSMILGILMNVMLKDKKPAAPAAVEEKVEESKAE
jgi:uracil permease